MEDSKWHYYGYLDEFLLVVEFGLKRKTDLPWAENPKQNRVIVHDTCKGEHFPVPGLDSRIALCPAFIIYEAV